MAKSRDAFRTISEVADWLGVQAHVLRFWESKFSQVKPVKRAGGRRYYRPNDMLLLGGIRRLLHEDGLTIKGVQKILREEGINHVASLSQPLDDLTQSEMAEAPADIFIDHVPEPEEETGVVLNFESPAEPASEPPAETAEAPQTAEPEPVTVQTPEAAEPEAPAPVEAPTEETAAEVVETAPEPEPVDEAPSEPEPMAQVPFAQEPVVETAPEPEPEPEPEEQAAAAPDVQPDVPSNPPEPDSTAASLPAFLRRPMAEPPATDNHPVENAAQVADDPTPEPAAEPPAPKPRIIDMPPITPLDQIDAAPGVLTAALRTQSLTAQQAEQIAPLLAKLTTLRDSMAARRRPGPSD